MAKEKTKEEYLDFLVNETIKSKTDITYFSDNYCKVHDKEAEAIVDFKLFEYQKTTLKVIEKNKKIIVLKARQMGITAISVLLAVHRMSFRPNYKIVIVSDKQDTSNNFVKKVKEMWFALPEFIRGETTKQNPKTNNETYFEIGNGSSIKACSSNPESSRNISSNLIIFDEMAFCKTAQEVFKAVTPTLSKDGTMVMLSSPNSTNGFFYDYWRDAEKNKNGFTAIKLDYTKNPRYTQEWADATRRQSGERAFNQEYCCEFGNAGDTVFLKNDIDYYTNNTVKIPLYTYGANDETWVWEDPNYDEQYVTIVDTATGDGKDSSTIQVIKLSNSEQVLEAETSFDPKRLASESISVAGRYNKSLLIFENTGIGFNTCNDALYMGYDNFYKTGVGDVHNYENYVNNFDRQTKIGFPMSHSVRPNVISKFIKDIELKSFIIHSSRTVSELKTFIWKRGKAQSTYGANDDLIMPLAIYSYLKDTAMVYANRHKYTSQQMVSSIQIYKPTMTYTNVYQQNYQNIMRSFDLDEYDIFKQ